MPIHIYLEISWKHYSTPTYMNKVCYLLYIIIDKVHNSASFETNLRAVLFHCSLDPFL
jgi:hypothetical protein